MRTIPFPASSLASIIAAAPLCLPRAFARKYLSRLTGIQGRRMTGRCFGGSVVPKHPDLAQQLQALALLS